MEKDKKYVFYFLLGFNIINVLIIRLQQSYIKNWKKESRKNSGLFLLMNQWVNLKQDGKGIEQYFIQSNLKRIAIYGMGHIGRRLIKELKGTEVEVIYGIDRNAADIYSEIELVTMDDEFKDVDAVVVTLVDEYEAIYKMLSQKISCPILAIEDIINEA